MKSTRAAQSSVDVSNLSIPDAEEIIEEALNEFLRRYARKSHELGGAKTFLAIDDSETQDRLAARVVAEGIIPCGQSGKAVGSNVGTEPGSRVGQTSVKSPDRSATVGTAWL